MSLQPPIRPFPIPLVPAALGPGSQPEDGPPGYLPMPHDMSTFHAPALPEPEQLAAHAGALAALRAARAAIGTWLAGGRPEPVALDGLSPADRALVNQVLGEGEVAARVAGDSGVQAQESVFAGVWRVLHAEGGRIVRDTIEVGAVPRAVVDAAAADGSALAPLPDTLPAGTMNAPALLAELGERSAAWRPGDAAHVMNLTLLPITPGDSLLLEGQLGHGRVAILSRGYGNCRIVDTRLARTWRVTYFNSQDMIILDTLEVGAVPEVACAAREDLADSAERLDEVLQWVESA